VSKPAISVENLGKMYRLSHQGRRADSFREAITNTVLGPLRRLRQLSGREETMEEFWALKDVSFEVQPGEVVGIIGRNGAGKSTLLKVLSRIVEPTEGRAVLRGRVASLLEVGTGFHPELSGRENIYLNGSILGMKKREIDAKFDEIVAFSEVEKFLDTPVKRYSSGMYVRLAFAVAAHLDPEILIVDEVLAVGDAEFQKKCLGKMKQVATGTGRTVLFVSHNMAAVSTLCGTGVMLERGQVLATGPVTEIVDRYLSSGRSEVEGKVTPSRPHGASIWITRAELTGGGPDGTSLRMGDELTLRVHFEADPATARPRLGWVLSDASGSRLLCANNRYSPNPPLPEPASEGTVECRLGMVPLMAGRYQLSLYLGDEVRDTHVLLDALNFEIAPHDVWGEGKTPPQGVSAMWWPSKFSVDATETSIGL